MKKRFYFVLILAVAASAGSCFGQARDSTENKWLAPSQVIKFSPLHLMNFYPTIELSYEHRLADRFTLQGEFGYVLDYGSNTSADFQDKRGFKAKVEPRYYLAYSESHMYFYTSGELYLNRINFDRETYVNGCIDQWCEFRFVQRTEYEMKYREHGASLKLGWIIYFHRFLLDLNSGWTVRVVSYSGQQQTFDDMIEVFDFGPDETDRTQLSPNLGIRLGYRLE
jgi:hypothetical protein